MDAATLDLNQKLDLLTGQMASLTRQAISLTEQMNSLTEQVSYLSEQARLAGQARESRTELIDTAMPVAREAMRLAESELGEVQDYLRPADLLRMLKKLIVHGPQLEQLLDQLDSVSDLMNTAGPVIKLGMDSVTAMLDDLDRKGYFAFARGSARLADTVVTSLSEEDLDRLGKSIPGLLQTVKDAAKPETVEFLHQTLVTVEDEVQKPVDSSLGGLLRQLRNPDVRRGLAVSLRLLQVIGAQTGDSKNS